MLLSDFEMNALLISEPASDMVLSFAQLILSKLDFLFLIVSTDEEVFVVLTEAALPEFGFLQHVQLIRLIKQAKYRVIL